MVPVVFVIYKRLETTKQVFKIIKLARPQKLYIIADGPKNLDEENICFEVKNFVENNIDWDCELIKVYSNNNLGCAKRIQTGLDYVFENEEMAIILEDDTLPDPSFFNFCEELLERYNYDLRVTHISGCNEYPDAFNTNESYCFSSIINIWGWATWRRAWRNFDLNMSSWEKQDKEDFLKNWCSCKREMNGKKKMFDLHCNNPDPWTWDYQWVYSCWKNKGLSIIPSVNLVSNIGIGPDATNTSSSQKIEKFPMITQGMTFPLLHPDIERDQDFDKRYLHESKTPIIRRLKNIVKNWL